jgi:antitoxin Phd
MVATRSRSHGDITPPPSAPTAVSDLRHALASARNVPEPQVEVGEVSATGARNGFAQMLETTARRGVVVIHKQNAPKAVLVSFDEFQSLLGRPRTLDVLTATFDTMLVEMQKPRARAGMKRAFDAKPEALGAAAVAHARKRGG